MKRPGNLISGLLLVAASTPAGEFSTGAGAGTVGLKSGVGRSADTSWGGCMGGSSDSLTPPSDGGVDVAAIFEGPTSTSRVCSWKLIVLL